MNCVYVDNKPNQKRILSNIAQGLGIEAVPLSSFNVNSSKGPIFFMGIAYGTNHLYKWCRANNRDFYYIDHAYVLAGYNENFEWMRITHNEFLCNSIGSYDIQRHQQYFSSIKCQSFRGIQGQYILASAPSDGVEYVFPGSKQWFKQYIHSIASSLGLPIRMRPKALQVNMNKYGQISEIRKNALNPLAQDLELAACVVTYNSNLAVDAALRGIPVFVHNRNAAWPISQSLDCIQEPNTEHWLPSLLQNQFNTNEMQQGLRSILKA